MSTSPMSVEMSARPDAASPPTTGRRSTRRITWDVVGPHAAVIVVLLVISIVLWWRVWVTGHPTSTITCQCGDVSESLGYLAWTPWALVHGHNPFLSNAIYAGQGGANMLVNTTSMAIGLLFAPITWIFGPVAAFNVAVTLGPVVSGWCFFLAVRAVTRFVPGQIVASVLYGFSPFISGNDRVGHFWASWLILPPLAFLFLYDLFMTRRHRPVVLGVALGLLTVVEFFISTEMLAASAVIVVIGVVAAAAVAPRTAWARRRHVLAGLGVAAAIVVALLAYPAWFALYGPRHIVGYAWSTVPYAGVRISGIVSAGPQVHHLLPLYVLSGYFGPAGPTVSYLGIALLGFLLVSSVVWFRSRLAWVVVVIGVISWLFSLGQARAWMPWRLFEHVPVVSQIAASCFSAITALAAAILLALSADGWWNLAVARHTRRALAPHLRHDRRMLGASGAVLTLVIAATLIPVALTYSIPSVIHHEPIPVWFRHDAPRLAPQTVVLTYPLPGPSAMGWQAVDGMGFRIVGGYAIVPGGDGRHSEGLSPFRGSVAVLQSLDRTGLISLPSAPLPVLREMRTSLHDWGVQVVVVPMTEGKALSYAAGFFTAVLGRLPRIQGRAWVWYGLGNAHPLSIGLTALNNCVAESTKTDPLLGLRCVLDASPARPAPLPAVSGG
jgi:hypothetical protein